MLPQLNWPPKINELLQFFKDLFIDGNFLALSVSLIIEIYGNTGKDEKIELTSGFSVMLSDYKVKIPKIVFKKIDEEVKINLNFVYERKQ